MTQSSGREKYAATVIVTSDTCANNPAHDTSGQYVLERLISLGFGRVKKVIVSDDEHLITERVREANQDSENVLTITVGGTGLCPRDVTPEATKCLYDKHCTGISTALLMVSLRYSPHAALSRLTAGISGTCLIVNFPGKLKACKECFDCLEGFIDHALEQVRFDSGAIKQTHIKQEGMSDGLTTLVKPEVSPRSSTGGTSSSSNSICSSSEKSAPSSNPNGSSKSDDGKLWTPRIASGASDLPPVERPISPRPQSLARAPRPAKTESPFPLCEYGKALSVLHATSKSLWQVESVHPIDSLESAHRLLGDILASDICSKTMVPPFPVSTMDGYVLNIPMAMRTMVSSIGTLKAKLVKDRGEFEALQNSPTRSASFFCYQVNTGGQVPEKNFAVVPIEVTGSLTPKNEVPIFEVKPNSYVRKAGSDINTDNKLTGGTILGPVELGLAQCMGHRSLRVFKRPILGVLSTGDELVSVEEYNFMDKSKVVDTNITLLTSLFRKGGFQTVDCGVSVDDPSVIQANMEKGISKCDILVVTGGASMGTKDFVKDVILKMGGTIHFGRVNIKPGKPVAFASLDVGCGVKKFIFSLPGNPVSAYVTSLVLVLPFVDQAMRNHLGPKMSMSLESLGDIITVRIAKIVESGSGQSYEFEDRLEFLRAKLLDELPEEENPPRLVKVSLQQQSSRMLNLVDCDCLIMVNPSMKVSKLSVGQIYPALRLTY